MVGGPADVIINCNALRLHERGLLRRAIVQEAARRGARVHETGSLADLERAAHDIARLGTSAVVLAGGDGSISAGLTALSRAFSARPLPLIGVIPGGTVCTIARNLGFRGRTPAWAARILSAACAGSARAERQPTLRVRDDRGGDRVGFIAGTGLVVRFFELYSEAPQRGLATAAKLVARIFASALAGAPFARRVLSTMRCSLRVDDTPHAGSEWSLVIASVVRDVGLHFVVPYRAGEELERFHVVASGLSPGALGRQLPRALLGRPLKGEPRIDTLARSLSLAYSGTDHGYVLDGDLFRAASVNVEAGPVISVVAPGA